MDIAQDQQALGIIIDRFINFYKDVSSGGSKGGAGDARPPGDPNSFNFMQFLGKIDKFVCWCPPGELVPPPRGNPGSATGLDLIWFQQS